MRLKTRQVTLNVSSCSALQLAGAPYASGSGTSLDPYIICTADQLQALGSNPSDWGSNFKLMSDIDLSAFSGPQGVDGNAAVNAVPFNMIGDGTTDFSGVFDGNNNVIHNFSFTDQQREYVGIFGSISGTVQNLGVESANVIGSNHVGIAVGENNGGIITRVHSTGSVSTSNTTCYSNACASRSVHLIATFYVGGLVGENDGTISQSYSNASVNGALEEVSTGGLCGDSTGTVQDSFASGTVNSAGGDAAGLIAKNSGSYTNTYATGIVNVVQRPED